MKKIITFLIIIPFWTLSFISCTQDDVEDAITDTTLLDIPVTSTQTASTIKLSWKPVEGCSWYAISFRKSGETFGPNNNYQDLINDPITYTLPGLTANTSYDIKIEGTDYLVGGRSIASKTVTIKTAP
jgi:hypothetical protein